MKVDIVMPFLSETMEVGTIVAWLKHQGDRVSVGDGLVEIESDKVTMIYDSDAGGVVLEVLAAEGDTVPCGHVIARIGTTIDVQS